MSCDSPLIIKLGNLANPIEWIGQPRITHSLSQSSHTLSFETSGRLPVKWNGLERAKVAVTDGNGKELFLGNVIGRQMKGFPTNITTACNAVGYAIHTRKNLIRGRYKSSIETVLAQILDASGASPLITAIGYKTGQIAVGDDLLNIKDIQKDIVFDGKYLDEALNILLGGLASWYIHPAVGSLIIYQKDFLPNSIGGIDVQKLENGCPGALNPENIQPEFLTPDISRVIVSRSIENAINPRATDITRSHTHSILAGSIERFFPLLDKTNKVIKAVINPLNIDFCTNLALDPPSRSFTKTGGSASFSVLVGDTCSWTAQSQAAWVSISSGSSGSGDGTVAYTVSANPYTTSRSTMITVQTSGATANHFISQDGDPAGIPQGCDAFYFTLAGDTYSFSESPASSISLVNITDLSFPPRPKIGTISGELRPAQLNTPISGTLHKEVDLTIDLTEPTLSGHNLRMEYFLNAFLLTHGLPPGLTVSASGSVSSIGSVAVSDGGSTGGQVQTNDVLRTTFYGGSNSPIDLTPYIGGTVSLHIVIDAAMSGTSTTAFDFTDRVGCNISLTLRCD